MKEWIIFIYYEVPAQNHKHMLFSPALAMGLVNFWQGDAWTSGCEDASKATGLSCFGGGWSLYFWRVKEEFSLHALSCFELNIVTRASIDSKLPR